MQPTNNPLFFSNQQEFRDWLDKFHSIETELLVGFYKISSGKSSLTWSESVDQALCFGWIDSVRNSIDKDSYCIRFTPRRPSSSWSSVNIRKIEMLTKHGLMKPKGIKAYEMRKIEKSSVYSFENERKNLNEKFGKQFKANTLAWDFFIRQAPSYQKTVIHWITSAKQEKTQINRLTKVIAESENGKRIF